MIQQSSEQVVEHNTEVVPAATEQQYQPSIGATAEHSSCLAEQVLEYVSPEHKKTQTCPSVEELVFDATNLVVAELLNADSEHMPKAKLQPELSERPEQTEQLPVENLENEHPVMDKNNKRFI